MTPLIALLLLGGCSREEFHGGQTLTQTIAQAYADCNESEIRFLAGKQGMQTAFGNCGSNNFAHMSWSPNGRWLYFQLTHGGHLMDGEDKTILTVPTETPVANAAWLRDDLLAIPLGPAKDATSDKGRIALYNRTASTLDEVALDLTTPRDLQPGPTEGSLLLTGLDAAGARKVVVLDTATGATSPAFAWLDTVDAAAGSLVLSPAAGLVGVAGPDGGTLYKVDGTEIRRFPGAKRVVPHHEGRYVAIERDGDPVSPFDMRSWDELSEEARQRELARQEKWLENQPDWVVKEIVPPEVQVFDLQTNALYQVTSFWGDRFQWYAPRNYYASFVMFGIEGKQLNRNVALVDLREKLRMLENGQTPLGVEVLDAGTVVMAPVSPPTAPDAPTDPAAAAPTTEAAPD
ncbi:hypothetical protein L6R53_22905 [Myxococcota bacterium]|nr:hypothetical protein [Myxococcota bacterium]